MKKWMGERDIGKGRRKRVVMWLRWTENVARFWKLGFTAFSLEIFGHFERKKRRRRTERGCGKRQCEGPPIGWLGVWVLRLDVNMKEGEEEQWFCGLPGMALDIILVNWPWADMVEQWYHDMHSSCWGQVLVNVHGMARQTGTQSGNPMSPFIHYVSLWEEC